MKKLWIIGMLTLVLALVAGGSPAAVAAPSGGPATGTGQDILVVHDSEPLAYFGFYTTGQMTAPGWDLLQRTIDFVTGGSARASTDVILITYNGTLDPGTDPSGKAVNDHLVAAGYNVAEVHHQSDIGTLASSYYLSFDLVIYAWIFNRDATAVVDSGVPFIPELPISSCLGPSNAPSSTRAIVVSLTDAVNHPIKLTKPSLGVVS